MNAKYEITPYQKPQLRKSIWQLANSVVPFITLWASAYLSLHLSVWITLGLDLAASAFLIRIFILFHDCCHHSLFRSRSANETIGFIMGLLTSFPYQKWKREHGVHHAGNGNLDRRGTGDIITLTVDEYLTAPWLKRLGYRLYRFPPVMFGLGPLYLTLIQCRFNRKGARGRERWGTMATNSILIGLCGVLYWTLGWRSVLLVEGPILYLSAMAGIWLFYVQHQFEGAYFEETDRWSYESAALKGSSFYKLPRLLQWMTGNIGFHHVHHLSPLIPNYNLPVAHERNGGFHSVPTIGLWNSLKSLNYRLWDTKRKRLVGFAAIHSRTERDY